MKINEFIILNITHHYTHTVSFQLQPRQIITQDNCVCAYIFQDKQTQFKWFVF